MKNFSLLGKISLWLYLAAACGLVWLSRAEGSGVIALVVRQPPVELYAGWLTTPKGFFLLAMAPLVVLTLWEVRDHRELAG